MGRGVVGAVTAVIYVAWAVLVVVARLGFGARIRYVLASLAGLVLGLVVSTTGTPPGNAVPAGLTVGSAVAIALYLFTRTDVRLEWAPGRAYDVDPGPYPRVEAASLWIVAAFGLTGIACLIWR